MLVASALTPAAVVSPATLALSEFIALVSALINDVRVDLSASLRCLAAVISAPSLASAARRRSIRAVTAALRVGRSVGAGEGAAAAGAATSRAPATAATAASAVVRTRVMVGLSVGV